MNLKAYSEQIQRSNLKLIEFYLGDLKVRGLHEGNNYNTVVSLYKTAEALVITDSYSDTLDNLARLLFIFSQIVNILLIAERDESTKTFVSKLEEYLKLPYENE